MAIDLYEIYQVLDMDRIYTLPILLSYSAFSREVLKSGIHAMRSLQIVHVSKVEHQKWNNMELKM